MDLFILVLGALIGGVSYLVIEFWMSPLLKYIEIKHQVISDLVYYANVLDANNLNDSGQERLRERKDNNRKHASELRASFYLLPFWYKKHLSNIGENPVKASKALIGLSNSNENDSANQFIQDLRESLRIPDGIEE